MSAFMIEAIRKSWGWIGIEPEEIVGENEFGNLLVRDTQGKIWRLCPEDVYCEVVANNKEEYEILLRDPEFIEDWEMVNLVTAARNKLGVVSGNLKYCLKIPGVIGGEYGGENLATAPQKELIMFSGNIAQQMKDLPEGAQIEFKITD